jgi:selenocysteine insertion sequence-binding protein 2
MAAEDDFAWTVVENKHQKKQKSTPSPSEKKRNWDKFQKDDSRVMREAHSKEHSVKKEGVSTGRCEDSTTISVQKRRGLIVLDKPIPRPERLDDPALWPSLPKAESRDSSSSGTAVSYSAAAKHTPPKQPKPVPHKDSSKLSHSEGEGAREEEQMKSKKKKKKKKKSEGQEQPTEHKANQPLLFDIGSMLEAYTSGAGQQGQSKSPNVKLTPNSAQHRLLSSKRLETELLATNPLDSSAPVKRRGKEREDPKKKRPSAMRRVLIKEREERHRIREQGLEIPQNLDVTASPTDPPLERNAVAVEVQSLPKHLHNRQYREYCDQMAEPQIDSLVEVLLKELGRFQDRVYLKEPQKFKIKRRYICGLREVLKHLKLKKLKAVIVAQNLDRITSTGTAMFS